MSKKSVIVFDEFVNEPPKKMPEDVKEDFYEAVYEYIERACDADKRTKGLTELTSLLTIEDCIYGFMSLPCGYESRRYVK